MNTTHNRFRQEYQFTNLPHAHTLCDIRVSLRSGVSTSEDMWSNYSAVTVRTLGTCKYNYIKNLYRISIIISFFILVM